MSTFAQNPVILDPAGFGTTHNYSFACSAGNTLVVLIQDSSSDITSFSLTGAAGSLSLAYTSGLNRCYFFSNLPSGVTGFSYTTTAGHNDQIVIAYEGSGQLAFDVGGDMAGEFTNTVAVTVTTTAADALLVARWSAASGVFTPDAGYAATSISTATMGEYNSSALGAAGSETIGGTFDNSAGGRGGFAVAFRGAGGGPSGIAKLAALLRRQMAR